MNRDDHRKLVDTAVNVIYKLTPEMRQAFLDFYNHNRTCEECILNSPKPNGSVVPFIGETNDMKRIMHNWLDTMCDEGKRLGRKIAPEYKG